MPVHVAFLRAINVGGRTVRMDALRAAFEALGLEDVSTFIASGNVLFRSRLAARTLEPRIERHLRGTFGWDVDTFLRSPAELANIVAATPFGAEEGTTHVGFLRAAPAPEATRAVEDLATDTDAVRVHGRELYWLVRTRMQEAKLSGARLEKMLGMPATLRNLRTVERIVAKLQDA